MTASILFFQIITITMICKSNLYCKFSPSESSATNMIAVMVATKVVWWVLLRLETTLAATPSPLIWAAYKAPPSLSSPSQPWQPSSLLHSPWPPPPGAPSWPANRKPGSWQGGRTGASYTGPGSILSCLCIWDGLASLPGEEDESPGYFVSDSI